jgi:hypothetical protein
LSERQIAAAVGVGVGTVHRDIAESAPSGAESAPFGAAIEIPLEAPAPRGAAEIKEYAKKIRAAESEANRAERLEKIENMSRGNKELDTSQKYPIIYADPPWRYENPPIGASNRAIENHAKGESIRRQNEALAAMPVEAPIAKPIGSVLPPHCAKNNRENMQNTSPPLPQPPISAINLRICLIICRFYFSNMSYGVTWPEIKSCNRPIATALRRLNRSSIILCPWHGRRLSLMIAQFATLRIYAGLT